LRKEYYYSRLFNENRNDIKKQWRTINDVLGNKKKKNYIGKIMSISDPNEVLTDAKNIAEEFNSFFVSVNDKLKSSLDTPNEFIVSEFQRLFKIKHEKCSFVFFDTNASEIKSIINSLHSNKSPGFDGVSSFVIKNVSDVVSPVLSFLINLSCTTGVFPDALKLAVVIPLFKKGDIKDINNFRPISLLSVFSKIFEKAVKKRCLSFLNGNSFFSHKQFGFLEKISTEDALLHFCKGVYEGLNSKFNVGGVFVDITKAFDAVDHDLLLNIMWFAGFRGSIWNWFSSYLGNRVQCVKVNEFYSSFKPIVYGVPQGSVLGPILFLIFINSLCCGPFKGSVTSFADDTAFCYNSQTQNILQTDMQYDLDLLKIWFTFNKLTLSNKTKFVLFSLRDRASSIEHLTYKCVSCLMSLSTFPCNRCMNIDRVDNIKYLGIFIDKYCSWSEHIKHLNKYMLSAVRTFYYLKNVCPVKGIRTIYFSIVHSKLQYGITCWGGSYLSNINSLLVAQKRVIRIMAGLHRNEHTFPHFKELDILPLRYLYIYRVLRIFFIRGGHTCGNINIYSERLRLQNRVVLLKANYEAYRRFYTFCSLKFYNQLPLNVTSCKSLSKFLRNLKVWLFSFEDVEFLFL
jgi:hypothetical protein